jgi:hypothetical protein
MKIVCKPNSIINSGVFPLVQTPNTAGINRGNGLREVRKWKVGYYHNNPEIVEGGFTATSFLEFLDIEPSPFILPIIF